MNDENRNPADPNQPLVDPINLKSDSIPPAEDSSSEEKSNPEATPNTETATQNFAETESQTSKPIIETSKSNETSSASAAESNSEALPNTNSDPEPAIQTSSPTDSNTTTGNPNSTESTPTLAAETPAEPVPNTLSEPEATEPTPAAETPTEPVPNTLSEPEATEPTPAAEIPTEPTPDAPEAAASGEMPVVESAEKKPEEVTEIPVSEAPAKTEETPEPAPVAETPAEPAENTGGFQIPVVETEPVISEAPAEPVVETPAQSEEIIVGAPSRPGDKPDKPETEESEAPAAASEAPAANPTKDESKNKTGFRPDGVTPLDAEEKIFAGVGYISFLCFLPLLTRRDSEFAQHHARQAVVIFIGFMFLLIFGGFLGFAGFISFLMVIEFIAGFVIAYKGDWLKIPGIYEISLKLKTPPAANQPTENQPAANQPVEDDVEPE